jgi:hypothetical protein
MLHFECLQSQQLTNYISVQYKTVRWRLLWEVMRRADRRLVMVILVAWTLSQFHSQGPSAQLLRKVQGCCFFWI